ncbi:hypothetical protein GCM10009525_27460 [Streptosporangium amethystogenes subsp. fukuiense]
MSERHAPSTTAADISVVAWLPTKGGKPAADPVNCRGVTKGATKAEATESAAARAGNAGICSNPGTTASNAKRAQRAECDHDTFRRIRRHPPNKSARGPNALALPQPVKNPDTAGVNGSECNRYE